VKASKKVDVKDGAAGKKMFSTSTSRGGTVFAPKRALNLFGSNSSASVAPLEWPYKRSKGTPLAKDVPKSSS
jgi:hypothetical protein